MAFAYAVPLSETQTPYPDTQVDGISPQTLPKHAAGIVSPSCSARKYSVNRVYKCYFQERHALVQFADSCVRNAVIVSTQLRVPPLKRREVKKQQVSRVVENAVVMSGGAASETGNYRR
jgi:hypothetical protein